MIQALNIEKTEDLKKYFIEQETICQSVIQKVSDCRELNEDESYVVSCAIVDMMDRLIKMNTEIKNTNKISEFYIDTAICFLARYRDDISLILEELEQVDDDAIIEFIDESELEEYESEETFIYKSDEYTGILH